MANDFRHNVVACSKAMLHAFQRADRFGRCSAPVLITGESGTGKEVVAKRIHESSPRKDKTYVRVNCAALSESLFESELFGHEAGAFTGAIADRMGRFELASEGTLLLDEISEIPLRLQAKLLRVLEEGELERVGGNESRQLDVRVLATSNRDLRREVAKGEFREDLFYRLSVLQIEIPPLRERPEDILPLAEHFLKQFSCESDFGDQLTFDDSAVATLQQHDWPGNVRELRNVIHQTCVLASQPVIRANDIPPLDTCSTSTEVSLLDIPLEESERWIIEKSIKRFRGNKTAAARHLGISVRTLHNKMRKYSDAA